MAPSSPTSVARHELAALVPREWRSRYGDEFTELLVAGPPERPRSWRRTVDVTRTAASAAACRSEGARRADPRSRPRRCARAWSARLRGGRVSRLWRRHVVAAHHRMAVGAPDTSAATAAMVVMSCIMVLFVPSSSSPPSPRRRALTRVRTPAGARASSGRRRCLWAVGRSWSSGAGTSATGGRGTRLASAAAQGVVPGGVAAFSWASTLSISSYWAHPGRCVVSRRRAVLDGGQPGRHGVRCRRGGQGPAAAGALGADAALRGPALGVAARAMLVFLGACCGWVLDGGPGPAGPLPRRFIDVIGIV